MTRTADLEAMRLEHDVEAAVVWVVAHLDRGVRPEELALVVPDVALYAPLLADRLRRLPCGPGTPRLGLRLAEGVPAGATPGGLRVRGLLRALASGLALDETIRVLPWLRRAAQARDDQHTRLSASRAREIAYDSGLAGTAAATGGALDWAGRLHRRRARLQGELATAEHAPLAERRRRTLEHQAARRWLKDVEPIIPGVEALQALATAVNQGAAAAAVIAFVRRWLRMPVTPADILDGVAAALDAAGCPVMPEDAAALRAVADAVLRARVPMDAGVEVGIFAGTAAEVASRACAAVWAPDAYVGAAEGAAVSTMTPRATFAAVARHQDESGAVAVPPQWAGDDWRSVERIRTLSAAGTVGDPGALDGFLDADAWASIVPPGLTPERPISATGVAALLSCPYRFLLERILFLREPPRRPPDDGLLPVVYGQLFHAAAERFFATAGPAVCARQGGLEEWLAVAADVLTSIVDEHFAEQPLAVAGAADAVRRRLHEQMDHLVRHEWASAPRTFVASEWAFGDPEPLSLEAGDAAPLHLRGAVDRLDRLADGRLAVRDLKTGRVRPLAEEPLNPGRDLQLGMYVLVLESARAGVPGPVGEAAYVYPTSPGTIARVFVGPDLEALRVHTREWLSTASALLRAGVFPHTVREAECGACAFRVVCGERAWARSAAQLACLPLEHPAGRFGQLDRRRAGRPAAAATSVEVAGPARTFRQFLLGLRALANRDDGVAEVALLRPPFFAADLSDVITERAGRGAAVTAARALRMGAVRAVIDALRLRRHEQLPGAVARDLIEHSALGRVVAVGPAGTETLALLYGAAAELDRLALRHGLDFDAVTEPVRAWLAAPDWTDLRPLAPGSGAGQSVLFPEESSCG